MKLNTVPLPPEYNWEELFCNIWLIYSTNSASAIFQALSWVLELKMAMKILSIKPWLTLRSACTSWRERVGWCVQSVSHVSCVWLDYCFLSVPSQDLVFLFVCLFQIPDLALYLPRTIEALSILSPWTDTSTQPQVARQTLPTWPPSVGSTWQVCSQKVGLGTALLQLNMLGVEAFGETEDPILPSNVACLVNKAIHVNSGSLF